MRAVQVTERGDPAVLEPTERPAPEPDGDEVLIDVAAAGVNFADVEKRRGAYPDAPRPPYVPGIEVAGGIAAAGADADRAPGERVAAVVDAGGYAEAATASADALLPVPDGLTTVEAAAFPVQFLTAHNALHEWGGLESGERVLIHAAAGGVGSAAVQIASLAGAEIYATASTAGKREFARELGADRAIDYTDRDVAAEIERATGGAGVDLVLDGVGGDAFYAGIEALADAGRIVAFGMASGDVPTVSTPRLLFENQSVIGYHLGHALEQLPGRVRAAVDPLAEAFAAGELSVHVDDVLPLAEAATAHRRLESRETTGKLLLEP